MESCDKNSLANTDKISTPNHFNSASDELETQQLQYSITSAPIKDNVKVMIRVRPFNEREKGEISYIIIFCFSPSSSPSLMFIKILMKFVKTN